MSYIVSHKIAIELFFYTKTLSCRLFKNCVFISPIKFTSFLQTRCYVLTISCMSTLAIVMLCFMQVSLFQKQGAVVVVIVFVV